MHYVEHGHREGRQPEAVAGAFTPRNLAAELGRISNAHPSFRRRAGTGKPEAAGRCRARRDFRSRARKGACRARSRDCGDRGGNRRRAAARVVAGVQDSSLPSGLRRHARRQRCNGGHCADRQPRGDPRRRCRVPVGAGEPAVATRAQPPVSQAPGRSLLASTRLRGAWRLLRALLARHEQTVAPTALRSRGLDRTRDHPRSLDPGLEQRASARGRAAWMRRVYVPRADTSPPRRKRRRGGRRPVVRGAACRGDARRSARGAGGTGRWHIASSQRVGRFFTHAPTVSIVIPCHEQIAHTRACIHALEETIPTWFRGEILIVDDASSPSTVVDLQELADAIHT